MSWKTAAAVLALLIPATALADDSIAPSRCDACAAWNAPQTPFRIYGNTFYVGTRGLSAILVVSGQDLILIDGALPESAPQIADHIRALGFDPKNIKLILNSHAHFDHAGGLAWLQRLSGARVALSPWSAQVLRAGKPGTDDPQHDIALVPVAPVARIETLQDGQTVHVGDAVLTAHFTPGHTPGGTSWSWQSCAQQRCVNIVYADSLTAVSADTYRYGDHPALRRGFDSSFATLERLPCDILLTPHPVASGLFDRLVARDTKGHLDAFIDPSACRKLVSNARTELAKRLTREASHATKHE